MNYRFRIRPDARWSDGTPLTADDFAFTWRAMRDEGGPRHTCSMTSARLRR